MISYKDRALAMIDSFPDGPEKASLTELVTFTTERKK
jgi:geranylgeranyl pyrophosphate synthase